MYVHTYKTIELDTGRFRPFINLKLNLKFFKCEKLRVDSTSILSCADDKFCEWALSELEFSGND